MGSSDGIKIEVSLPRFLKRRQIPEIMHSKTTITVPKAIKPAHIKLKINIYDNYEFEFTKVRSRHWTQCSDYDNVHDPSAKSSIILKSFRFLDTYRRRVHILFESPRDQHLILIDCFIESFHQRTVLFEQ
jgi:hypothetical protein